MNRTEAAPGAVVETTRELFERTHWTQAAFARVGTGGKLQFCLLGGLRFVQWQYESIIDPAVQIDWSTFEGRFSLRLDEDPYPEGGEDEYAERAVRNMEDHEDRATLEAVVAAIYEHKGYEPEDLGRWERESLEDTVIDFNDDYETELSDVLTVLTRAGAILGV